MPDKLFGPVLYFYGTPNRKKNERIKTKSDRIWITQGLYDVCISNKDIVNNLGHRPGHATRHNQTPENRRAV